MIRYLTVLTLFIFLAACSSVEEKPTPPKPIAQKKPAGKSAAKKPAVNAAAPALPKPSSPGPKTYALDEAKPSFALESTGTGGSKTGSVSDSSAANANSSSQPGENNASAGVPVVPSEQVGVPATNPQPAMTMAAYTPEEVRMTGDSAPAVVALVNQADGFRKKGDYDASVSAIERALRIDSRNAALTYKLAQLRLTQHKPQLAEELAGKAALLAAGDLELKRKSWMLIAEARRQQQDIKGAKEAKAKAESFFGR